MNGKPHKKFPWFWYMLAFFVIVAFAFAPIGLVMLCAAIANANGCKVDEGSAHPCIINGHDYGELLYSLGVMGWFMLVTIPGGLVAFASWLIFLILHRVAWRKRSSGIPPPVSKWLNDNGPKMEKMLMDWNNSPSPASLRALPRNQACVDGAKRFATK